MNNKSVCKLVKNPVGGKERRVDPGDTHLFVFVFFCKKTTVVPRARWKGRERSLHNSPFRIALTTKQRLQECLVELVTAMAKAGTGVRSGFSS